LLTYKRQTTISNVDADEARLITLAVCEIEPGLTFRNPRRLDCIVIVRRAGLRHSDIWPVLGNKGATSEILNGKRSISKVQAKKLAEFFSVPLELFI
jgi:HTH-type transcriptional regulator/antitoxin HigA